MTRKALLLVASLFTLALPVVAEAVNVNIVTDTSWTVYDDNNNFLGNAQYVCLNASAPSNCPANATQYGYNLPGGWAANLSGIPNAKWIWAPNITGATSSAANAEFVFKSMFFICGAPSTGTIFLAADDSAEVFLNCDPNGPSCTSVANSAGHGSLSSFQVDASKFNQGINTIDPVIKH